jgi:DNA helicase-2/ATP-dependent DNA helicase PcrA
MSSNTDLFSGNLNKGNIVKHQRFGLGEVMMVEGVGVNQKASIRFENGGLKKILLRFSKLDVVG